MPRGGLRPDGAEPALRLPPLNAVRAFEVAARHQSFKEAAAELCVTQGAVSRQIGQLEDHLATKLFVRLHRGVTLTAAGRRFYVEVQEALRRIAQSAARFAPTDDPRTLKVKLTPSPAICWLVPRLARFHALHPDLSVQVTTSHDPVDFAEEEVDIGIFYGRPDQEDLVVEALFPEILVPVGAPKLAKGGCVEPAMLHEQVLLYSLRRPNDWTRWFAAAGLGPVPEGHRHLVLENSALVYQCAAEGVGVALAQLAFVAEDLRAGRLVAPFDIRLPGDIWFHLAVPARKQRLRKVAAFRAWVSDLAATTRRRDMQL